MDIVISDINKWRNEAISYIESVEDLDFPWKTVYTRIVRAKHHRLLMLILSIYSYNSNFYGEMNQLIFEAGVKYFKL